MSDAFQVTGANDAAAFTWKVHRGDGMALLAMNWKGAKPPTDFVGLISFQKADGEVKAAEPFVEAFENYWAHDFVKGFGPTDSTSWISLGLAGDLPQPFTSEPSGLSAQRAGTRKPGEKPWWSSYYTSARRVRDRELFA